MRGLQRFIGITGLAAAAVASTSCGDVVRTGRSPVFLEITLLQGATGNVSPGPMGTVVESDVSTSVTSPAPCSATSPCQTIFSDPGQVILSSALKDVTNPAGPTSNNNVTITRYHVSYRRADGRNTPGVDVPYAFDGAATGTLGVGGSLTLGFELVRHDAKMESPLVQLKTNPQILGAIADVTFFGRDLVGNDVSVTGSISIEFGNFGE
jgi:hypothetical protein